MLVVDARDLEENRTGTLRRIYYFLGADPDFASPLFRHRRNMTGHQVIPNATGRRLMASSPMQWAMRHLPGPVFYHLRNLVLAPFAAPPPDLDLPADLEASLRERFRKEVVRLREMTGEEFADLGFFAGPLC